MKVDVTAVILTAGWGDGTTEIALGFLSAGEEMDLNTIADGLDELVEVVHIVHGTAIPDFDLLYYVKWWVLGGHDDLMSQTEKMTPKEFIQFARKNAPTGYQSEED